MTARRSTTIADAALKADVEDELEWDPAVPEQHIGVAVTDHAVTLAGTVHTLGSRLAAVRAARRVKNVHAIIDEIQVVPIGDHRNTDENIGLAVERILESNTTLPTGLKATVRGGEVTLTGRVDHQFQRDHAARLIRDVRGVRAVHNDIALKISPSDKAVRSRIVAALHRNADIDARDIQVTTTGNDVWLTGHVHSLAARRHAENAAWAAPGVLQVHNDIKVGWSAG